MARRPDDSGNWGGKRAGAGRKPPPVKKKTVSVCLPLNILELAQGLAKQREISFSIFVERSLMDSIQKLTDSHIRGGVG